MWPFRTSRAETDAAALLSAVMNASRKPQFFGENRVADTLEGRFEVAALHAALALRRLRGAPGAAPLAQAFTDQFFRHLDAGLREAGVGDLSVAKRMHKLAGAFYGRLKAYDDALDNGDGAALARALGRNMLGDDGAGFASALAAHAAAVVGMQAKLDIAALLNEQAWPLAGL
jgi:cytochrome b pre-mRNA-processing protein 3